MSPGFLSVRPQDWATPTPPATSTRLYIVGDSGAIYKSTDGGVSWANLTGHGLTGVEYRMAVEGRSGGNDRVYLRNASGLAVSLDGGATWAPGTDPPSGAGTLEVGEDGTVYSADQFSTDHAASWSAIPSSGFMESVTTSKLWSAYDDTQVSRMNLNGSSQELLALAGSWVSGPHARGVSDTVGLCFGGDIDSSTLLEKLVGTTATVITPATSIGFSFMDAASNDGGTTILAAIYEQNSGNPHLGELWRSTNGGSSWTRVLNDANLIPSFGNRGPHIVYDPNSTSSWYVLGGSILDASVDAVIWRSTDNGVTWTSLVVAVGEFELNLIRATSG